MGTLLVAASGWEMWDPDRYIKEEKKNKIANKFTSWKLVFVKFYSIHILFYPIFH